MACIEKIYSVSALVGSGVCNANCDFCAGKPLRSQAPGKRTNENYLKNLESAIKLSARYGGWSLSLTSSGEPTCSPDAVTEALDVYDTCAKQGAYFPNVNLFTNGIMFGDTAFCNKYLHQWKNLGLTNVVVSIHSSFQAEQAYAYGFKNSESYPQFGTVFDNIRKSGLGVRCTILLRKDGIDNPISLKYAIDCLSYYYGVNNITCWPVGNPDGSRNGFTPSRLNMARIKWWLSRNAKLCHGHVWGGGVYDYKGTIVRLTDYVTRHNPKKDYVRQLVVFQDGTVTYSWIKEGALCMK